MQPTFGPGLNPWGVNYLTNVLPASATSRRLLMLYNDLIKNFHIQVYAPYYLDSLSPLIFRTNDLYTCLYEPTVLTNKLDLLKLAKSARTTDISDISRFIIPQTSDSCQTNDSCHQRGSCQTTDSYGITRLISNRHIYIDDSAFHIRLSKLLILALVLLLPSLVLKLIYRIIHPLISKPSSQAVQAEICLLYTSPSPRDRQKSRMPSSA